LLSRKAEPAARLHVGPDGLGLGSRGHDERPPLCASWYGDARRILGNGPLLRIQSRARDECEDDEQEKRHAVSVARLTEARREALIVFASVLPGRPAACRRSCPPSFSLLCRAFHLHVAPAQLDWYDSTEARV